MRIGRREDDRRSPGEAVLEVGDWMAAARVRPWRDIANLMAAAVEDRGRAVVAAGDDQIVVVRHRPDPSALGVIASDVEPILVVDAAPAPARNSERAHVLLTAEQRVRKHLVR